MTDIIEQAALAIWYADNDLEHVGLADGRIIAQVLADVGLLAKANTQPTVGEIKTQALKRAYRDRATPIHEEDAWAFGEGVRAGIDAVLTLMRAGETA